MDLRQPNEALPSPEDGLRPDPHRPVGGADPVDRAEPPQVRGVAAQPPDVPSPNRTDSVEKPFLEGEAPLRVVGPYQILGVLGRGGMGTVYVAEQSTPVRRRVALKVINAGLDSKSVIARFEIERQALAMMDHPCIARVYEAGQTPDGRPWFAMEHVAGISVTQHCDRHRLSVQDRLELFIQICEAVQHAHQKGVIHRDLKPSNILVAIHEDRAIPKIIDFGVAKAINQRLTEKTLFTEQGRLIGTPEYMSPEQAEMTAQDIDTRSDLYALGVLLYELLTGSVPFDAKTLRKAGLAEIVRIIREVDPPKPSTRLSLLAHNSADTSFEIARHRRADTRTLSRSLSGDLDWITMKALEKDRTRRYATANDFADDIRRHLRHEPVRAARPGPGYQASKFIRRHRVGMTMALVTALLMILATGVSLIQASRARQAEILASLDRNQARREAAKSSAVTRFLEEMLKSADPARARDIRVRDVLDKAARDMSLKAPEDPEVEAAVRTAIGSAYLNLLLPRPAKEQLEIARRIRESVLGPEHPLTAETIDRLAWATYLMDDPRTAEALYQRCLQVFTRSGDVDKLANATANLGVIAQALNDFEKAAAYMHDALEMNTRVYGAESADVAQCRVHLGQMLALKGEHGPAQEELRLAVRLYDALGSEHRVRSADACLQLAHTLEVVGELAEARTWATRALEIRRDAYGERDPSLAACLAELGMIARAEGNLEDAETSLREALNIYVASYGEEYSASLTTRLILAIVIDDAGRSSEAEPAFNQVVDAHSRIYGEAHWSTANARSLRAVCLTRLERFAEAEGDLLAAYPVLSAAGFKDHMRNTAERLVTLYGAWEQPGKADAWRQRASGDSSAQNR
ncbi:MAG: hypothetical protein BroJett003_15020 [Planctomycetota bacterium]|nr:MAG: hypothetical protein BroJett003_15020 [Planctomycetota bacterium]